MTVNLAGEASGNMATSVLWIRGEFVSKVAYCKIMIKILLNDALRPAWCSSAVRELCCTHRPGRLAIMSRVAPAAVELQVMISSTAIIIVTRHYGMHGY